MAGVARHGVEARRPARVAAGFLDLLDAAEQAPRLVVRLVGREAGRLQTLGFAFEMELQLLVQIGFAAASEHDGAKAADDDVPDAHDQVRCSTRWTPADRRSHFATSAWSWSRPALVTV
ncbi:hypothetical protein D3C83_25530 [compost metagenome]